MPDDDFLCSWFRGIRISDGMSTMPVSKHSNVIKKLRMQVIFTASVCDTAYCRTLLSVTMHDFRFIVVI